jgi:hypothetical protein
MTRLFWLNFLVLQWLFVRRARVIEERSGKQIGWTWIVGVWPLTGWWSDFRFVLDRR